MSTKVNYKFDDLMNPTLQALKKLGGSGTNEEIFNTVSEILNIPPEQLEIYHNPEKGGMTEIEYRLRWTLTYLKKYEWRATNCHCERAKRKKFLDSGIASAAISTPDRKAPRRGVWPYTRTCTEFTEVSTR
jgi:hypothetical protein